MGKKKFFDKKKSATFQLMARDTSDPIYEEGPSADPSVDRVFVRVDTNQYTVPTLGEDEEGDTVSNADVSGDGYNYLDGFGYGDFGGTSSRTPLPDHVRKEILELGFPDDGYNYLFHLREIKNTGGGSAYYENPKAMHEELPLDVKAYDASRLNISKLDDEPNEKSMYTVASKTVNVKIQRAVDPEIVELLDGSDVSSAGSDSEDLDEDFVIKANLPEESIEEDLGRKLHLVENSEVDRVESKVVDLSVSEENTAAIDKGNSRARRLLDEQFDLLELQEYGSDCEDEYENYLDEDEDQVPLAEKLSQAFKDRHLDSLELDSEYKLPSDFLQGGKGGGKEGESLEQVAAGVILRCREYGEKYDNEDEDEKTIIYEESSEDEDVWDCETIITTYSNLDNHPGKIGAPENRRRKKVAETVSSDMSTPNRIIALKGKEKLPVDFLPRARKQVTTKEKDVSIEKLEQQNRKQIGQESKEDKKERKAAVKEERREARRMKKELKDLYKCEGQRAQKVAAFTGPSAIHLM